MSKGYNSKKSAKAYTSCCYSSANVKIHEANINQSTGGFYISPDEVVIDTKNYYFEKFHHDNYLLSSVRYSLRVCLPNKSNLSGLFVRLDLVDDRTDQEVKCVKRERAGKRVLKGKTKEELDLSKHGNLKAKLDFRFRETSTDNIVEWFRLYVHIIHDNQVLLSFNSEPFRTSVRSPTKKSTRLPPPPLNPTIIQIGTSSQLLNDDESGATDEDDDENDDGGDSGGSGSEENVKKQKSSSFPFLPPYQN